MFYTILGFTHSHSSPLGDIEGFVQNNPGAYKSEKPINITRIDKSHSKCDCFNRSIVNGIREPIPFNTSLDKPPGHKIYKEPRIKVPKQINKSVLSHITFYLKDDDHNEVDFNGETISFICQLLKK